MADNYLEKQMADYRAGRLNNPAPRVSVTSPRVFIISPDIDSVRPLVAKYRAEGCRTAFTCTDSKVGAALAQATGSQCHHTPQLTEAAIEHSLSYIRRHWGGLDQLIDLR